LLFAIKRQDRQDPPAQVFEALNGKRYLLHADGTKTPAKPSFEISANESGARQIQIMARTVAEARRMVKGVARKYPCIGFDVDIASVGFSTEYDDSPLKMPFDVGGEISGRSIVKSVLCLAVAEGVRPAACTEARAYLKDAAGVPCFGYYYGKDLLVERPPATPLHAVAVSNRGSDGQLLGYIEFFGFHRMLVCLADNYSGPDVHTAYAINPMTGQELAFEIDLALSKEELQATYRYERIPDGSREAILATLLPVAQTVAFERERDRTIARAFDEAMKACGVPPRGELPAEKQQEFARRVAERVTQFAMRYMRRPGNQS
jgi:hypothetical protein